MGWSFGSLCRLVRVVSGFGGLLQVFSLWGGHLVHCVGQLGWFGDLGGLHGVFSVWGDALVHCVVVC